jgi:hypothetical protein
LVEIYSLMDITLKTNKKWDLLFIFKNN